MPTSSEPECLATDEPTSYSFEPLERFAQLVAAGLIEAQEKPAEPSNFIFGRLVSNNSREADWMAISPTRKLISSKNLAGKDFVWIEKRLGLAEREAFKASKNEEPRSATEYSFDPVTRFNALGRYFKTPRGSKTTEHLAVLRASDPCLSSLAPRQTLPSAHELSYEPLERWAAMAPTLRVPRGHKTTEHLAILRASDPCLSSLAPRQTLARAHELSYEPLERWAAMAPTLRVPRGHKTTEHLAILRASDPCLSSLAPRQTLARAHELSYEPLGRWAAMAPFLREPRGHKSVEHLELLRQSNPDYGTLAPKRHAPREPLTLQQLSQMKRNMSVDSFCCDPDDADDLPELPGATPLAKMREWRLQRRASDGFDDDERSAARTMERASNGTIESFDCAKGEWGESCASPRLRPVSP